MKGMIVVEPGPLSSILRVQSLVGVEFAYSDLYVHRMRQLHRRLFDEGFFCFGTRLAVQQDRPLIYAMGEGERPPGGFPCLCDQEIFHSALPIIYCPFLCLSSASILSLSSSLKATMTYAMSTMLAITAAVAPAHVEFPATD